MSLTSEQYSFIMNKQDPNCVKYCSENHGHTSTVLKLPGFHDQTFIPWWAGRDLVLNQRCGCCRYVSEFAGGKFQCYRRDLKSPVYVDCHVGYKSHVVMKPLNVCKSIDQMYSTEGLTCLPDLVAFKANGTGLSMVHSCWSQDESGE